VTNLHTLLAAFVEDLYVKIMRPNYHSSCQYTLVQTKLRRRLSLQTRSGAGFADPNRNLWRCLKYISVESSAGMTNLYDRAASKIEEDKPEGITPLDIVDLPRLQQRVMLTLLRDQTSSTKGITREALASKVDFPDELPDVLAELTKNGWLILLGDPPTHYKINLRRKRGSSLGFGVWSSLTDKLSKRLGTSDDE
jgi:hypothetical protein